MPQDEKVSTSIRVQRSTFETLADTAREQGFATIGRTNISAAIDHVTEFYRRMNERRLVDTRSEYITTRQG